MSVHGTGVHPKSEKLQKSMVVSRHSCRKALVGTGRAISILWLRNKPYHALRVQYLVGVVIYTVVTICLAGRLKFSLQGLILGTYAYLGTPLVCYIIHAYCTITTQYTMLRKIDTVRKQKAVAGQWKELSSQLKG